MEKDRKQFSWAKPSVPRLEINASEKEADMLKIKLIENDEIIQSSSFQYSPRAFEQNSSGRSSGSDLPTVRRVSNVPISILDSKNETEFILNSPREKRKDNILTSPHLQGFTYYAIDQKQSQKLPEYKWILKFCDNASSTIDVSHKLLGDNLLLLLADSLPSHTSHLLIQDNRLTDQGIVKLLQVIENSKLQLETLDLSENHIRKLGADELCKFIQQAKSLVKLSLRNMNITDSIARSICQTFHQVSSNLISLNLSDNKIEDSGAIAIAGAIKETHLTELDLSWNSIKHIGAIAIADVIQESNDIQSLDLSWNAIGTTSDQQRNVAKAISDMLERNSSLTHLDLSHNQLNTIDCTSISEGLSKNHSLLGLHMTGNQSKTDAYGHLVPDAQAWPLESAHSMTRIIGSLSRVVGREQWTLRNACWICGCWREINFKFVLRDNALLQFSKDSQCSPQDIKVYLATSFDNWVPELMYREYVNDTVMYDLFRMTPPGIHYYLFLYGDDKFICDVSQPHVPIEEMVVNGIVVSNDFTFPQHVNTIEIPELSVEEKLRGYSSLFSTVQPRIKNSECAPRKIWTVEDSIFAGLESKYSDKYFIKCFANDWKHCKSSKIKDTLVVASLESTFIKYFQLLKDVFTHYCCVYSSEVFFLTIGGFNEFVSKCKIIEGAGTNSLIDGFSKERRNSRTESILPEIKPSAPGSVLDDRAKNVNKIVYQSKGYCTRTEVDLIFTSNTITGLKHEYNSKRSLCRFQFWDCLVALSNAKFVTSGLCKDVGTALQMLIVNHIEPYAERDDGQYFRKSILLTEDIDVVLKSNMQLLEKVFKAHSGQDNLPLEPKTMCIKEWIDVCDKSALSDANFNERPTKLAFCRSKILDVNIFDENASFKKMSFLEFLEALVRASLSIRENIRIVASLSRSPSKTSLSKSPSKISLANSASKTSLLSNSNSTEILLTNNISSNPSSELLRLRKGIGSLASKDVTKFNDFITMNDIRNRDDSLDDLSVENITQDKSPNTSHDVILSSSCFTSDQIEALSSKDVAECLKNIIKNRLVFSL